MKFVLKGPQAAKWKILSGAISGLVITALTFSVWIGNWDRQEGYVYKETRVEYGKLTIGITKSGSIDIGTVEQTFDLDMSALQRVDTGNFQSSPDMGGSAGGMPAMEGVEAVGGSGLNMFSQMFGGGGTLTGIGEDSSLIVAGVRVSVGRQVAEGDILY